MAPFFAYSRFSSIGDELIGLLPERVSAAVAANAPSDESAEASDRLADDQVLHLVGALVGVERLGVGKKASGLVVGDDAVAAEHLARPCDGLAALRRAERLGERRMSVRQFALGMQLGLAHDQALRRRDVGNHPGEEVLHQLERPDRLAELQAL